MVERRRKKKNILRGHRTHGAGNTKNRRGAGSRGGVGKAGSKKHKFSKYHVLFGIKVRLKPRGAVQGINLDAIEPMLAQLKAKEKLVLENNMPVFDGLEMDVGKLLSRGTLSQKIFFKNVVASKAALKKIEDSGSILDDSVAEPEQEVTEETVEETQ